MRIMVSEIVNSCDYKLSSFLKVLTRNGISNHFELVKEDLIKLYQNERVYNRHSLSLRNYLREVLKDDLIHIEKSKAS